MKDTYTTKKSGVELKLRAVDPLAIHNILYRIGVNIGDSREKIKETIQIGNAHKLEAISQLFGYCMSQAVITDPPDDALDELEAMGFPIKNKNVARVYWLRHIELENQEEAGDILSIVIGLTFAPKPEDKREFEQAIDDEE